MLIVAVLPWLLFAACTSPERVATHGEFENPVVFQRADPWIHRHDDGYYYFTATVPEYDRLEIRRARTIEGLEGAKPRVVWRKRSKGELGSHIWAPELHFIDGKWYLYFAAGGAEDVWAIRMYVLECSARNPVDGEWTLKGRIQTKWESFSLDATTFAHAGRRYLVWAQHEPGVKNNTDLYIAAMSNPWTIEGDPVRISRPELAWEKRLYSVNEGAAVLVRNGRVHVVYSASGTNHHYCMGLLSADAESDLLDPASWTKSQQPVFRSHAANSVFGPGHCSFTTSPDGKTDLLVYHARSYREIQGDPLHDPNRHTRVQPLRWDADGMPVLGDPAPTRRRPSRGSRVARKPLFVDPTQDGAADPAVIWNKQTKSWFMFYTNRRARARGVRGVEWVHGTRIGIAESRDGGASWRYLGRIKTDIDLNPPHEQTHWAPAVFEHGGLYHMYLTYVPGVFRDWRHPRSILHLTSEDLRRWKYRSKLELASGKVIDATVLRLADGRFRMWYNNERDRKSIYYADSKDLFAWKDKGKATGDQGGEGPVVFRWHGSYWMIVDVWDGLAVYKSDDATRWSRQPGNLLRKPGKGLQDGAEGQHADVVVAGDRAFLFYFVHPGRTVLEFPDEYRTRRSVIQVCELEFADGRLSCDRDAPTMIDLSQPGG